MGCVFQYHLAISSYWPLPIHRSCACRQTLVKPGQTAEPWVDYRKMLDSMSPAQRREAIGASNYKLLSEGVVKWDDVVTNSRVRSFREVVAREKLTVPELKAMGVSERIAQAAWDSTHTTGHQAAAAHRKALVDQLARAGVSPQQVRQGFAKGLAAKVRLVDIPPPATPAKVVVPPKPIEPLIKTLNLDAKKVKAAVAPKAPPKPPAFPASKAEVVNASIYADSRKATTEAIRNILGVGFDPQGIASIVGAPDDARVNVFKAGRDESVLYEVKHPKLDSLQGVIRRADDGTIENHVHAMYVKESERGKGFGASVHGRMVQFGAENGIDRLKLTAARGEEENGYVTWPIFGYDGPLPESARESLPESLRGRSTVQELMSDEEGQRWWKTNGDSLNMTFPLGPGSKAVERWTTYWTSKVRIALDE